MNPEVNCLCPETFPVTRFSWFPASRLRDDSTPPIPLCTRLGLGMPGGWDSFISCSSPSTGSHLKSGAWNPELPLGQPGPANSAPGQSFSKWEKNRAYDSELWGRATENIVYKCRAGADTQVAESLASGMKQWTLGNQGPGSVSLKSDFPGVWAIFLKCHHY